MVIVNYLDEIWCIDLMIMEPVIGSNHVKYSYLMSIIDMWSKFAWGIALKTKSAESIKTAIKIIFDRSNRKPKLIWMDKECGMYSKIMESFLKENNIKLYSVESEIKCGPI